MIPGKYDIKIHRGGTWSIAIEAQNAQDVGTNFDTAYDRMRMQIRPAWRQNPIPTGQPLLSLTTENGRITTQNSGTQIVLTISAADTAKLDFNAGQYELELVKDGDPEIVDKILYGSVQVTGEITV
jgi:hypothetical protein